MPSVLNWSVLSSFVECPHCGHTSNRTSEFLDGEEGVDEWECGECEKIFLVSRRIIIKYSCAKILSENE